MLDFFKKYWWLLLIILIVVLPIFAPTTFAAISGWVGSAWAWVVRTVVAMSWWQLLAVGLGLAFLIDPEGTARFLGEVAEWVGEVIGEIVSGVASGLGLPTLLMVGLGVYFLFIREDDSGQTFVERRRSNAEPSNSADPDTTLGGMPYAPG